MKKTIALATFLTLANQAIAQDFSAMNSQIGQGQQLWEEAKYRLEEKDQRLAKYEECAGKMAELAQEFPSRAEPIIWQGICTASQAELLKISALGKAKEAKALFEKALTIDPKASDGGAYVNLGVLYHRVPGWPIGFGSNYKARENFVKALEIAPQNIDANYFYALFLFDEDEDHLAMQHLQKALDAPSRNRPFADAKRKEEVAGKIRELR